MGPNALARATADRPRGAGAMFSLDCSMVSKSTRRGGAVVDGSMVSVLAIWNG